MEDNKYMGYTPDYVDQLLPKQIFVFGSNALGYHTGGASGTARKEFGAVWGQPEGLQGQSYATPIIGILKDEHRNLTIGSIIVSQSLQKKLKNCLNWKNLRFVAIGGILLDSNNK